MKITLEIPDSTCAMIVYRAQLALKQKGENEDD